MVADATRSVLLALPLLALMLLPSAATGPIHPAVPMAAEGYRITPLVGGIGVTAMAFGPGDDDGQDLYATTLTGDVVQIHLTWTPLGPVSLSSTVVASGFNQPLGIEAIGDDLYVADSHSNEATGRVDGRVTRIAVDGTQTVIVDGLPNGRHNTNHLRLASDGRLLITNGNANDNGRDGGDPDVLPLSGAVLSVQPDALFEDPAILAWVDAQGNALPPGTLFDHLANTDFRGKVVVEVAGLRNNFGVAEGPDGSLYTAHNGADVPASQDALFHATESGQDFGYPFCFHEGPAGAVGEQVAVSASPIFPSADCTGTEPATALLGWHTCTTGLDLPTPGPFAFTGAAASAVYVGECGPFQPDDVLAKSLDDDPLLATHNTGHKVRQVLLGADGEASEVHDFLTGLPLPLDVRFGPRGAMYIADATGILHVAPVGAVDPDAAPSVPGLPSVPSIPAVPGLPVDPEVPDDVMVYANLFQFLSPVVAVPAGTTVTWESLTLFHTVTSAADVPSAMAGEFGYVGDDGFNGLLPEGGQFSYTFDEPGIYPYFCAPHVGLAMVGVVVVV